MITAPIWTMSLQVLCPVCRMTQTYWPEALVTEVGLDGRTVSVVVDLSCDVCDSRLRVPLAERNEAQAAA